MRNTSAVVSVFTVAGLMALTVYGYWDTSDDFPARAAPKEITTGRRTPGWRTRTRNDNAAAELAVAERLRDANRWRGAVRRYRAVVAHWHDSQEGVRAQQQMARTLEEQQRYKEAFQEYQYLMEHYVGRFPFTSVLERQYELAMKSAQEARKRLLGRKSIEEPVAMLETLLKNAPRWEHAPSVKAMIGELYERDKKYDLAAMTYSKLRRYHPNTPEASAALFGEARAMAELTLRTPRDEDMAVNSLALLRRAMPVLSGEELQQAKSYAAEVEQIVIEFWRDRADFYDRIQNRPQSALIVYEEWLARFPDMDDAEKVRNRLETLREQMHQ